jgi:hypothetical protein
VLQITDWVGGSGSKPTTGLYVGTDGLKVNISDGVNIRGSSGEGGNVLRSYLSSDITANFTGSPWPWVDSGMEISMEADAEYEVSAHIGYLTSTSSIGPSFGFAGPVGLVSARVNSIVFITNTSSAGGTASGYGEAIEAVNGAGPSVERMVWLAGVVRNGATAGALKLQFRVGTSESSGSVTLKSPAWLVAKKIS